MLLVAYELSTYHSGFAIN